MEQIRATMITEEWGFVSFAADIYGANLQTVPNMTDRIELATLYRSDPTLFVGRIQAAIDLIKAHEKVNPNQVALFGYCFGGTFYDRSHCGELVVKELAAAAVVNCVLGVLCC
jgi:dienelactone hydrolase